METTVGCLRGHRREGGIIVLPGLLGDGVAQALLTLQEKERAFFRLV